MARFRAAFLSPYSSPWPAFLLLICLGFPSAGALRAASAKLPDTFDVPSVDAYLEARVREANRVGYSVVVVTNGRVALAKGYGKRSRADGRPIDTDTLFAIGSVSKQFTCTAILLLEEDGKLSCQDKVAKYYPDLTRAGDITLLDLMNHVSGYPDYYPLDFVDRRMAKAIKEDDLLREYAGGRLDFEPGTRWSYSNTGYILLGRVVEKVSGENLGSFLSRRVFVPRGMNHTAYEISGSDPRLAAGYQSFALSDPEPVAAEAAGWLGGAGGIYSTPGDLARWDMALIDGTALKPRSFAIMTTPRMLTGGKNAEYGCGLSVKTQGGRLVLSHSGAVSGFNTFNAVVPSTRSAVIMTCNLEGGMGTIPGQLLSLILKEQSNVPVIAGASASDTVRKVFAQLQSGKVDRALFAAEFNDYLTDQKVRGAAERLKSYGQPRKVELLGSHERGGMEVTTARLVFASGELRTLMYRQPNGVIEQFFVSKE